MQTNKQKRFIKNLTYTMEQLNLDNKQLAYILKCRTPAVSSWVSGKNMPSKKNLSRLALLTGMSEKNFFKPSIIFKLLFKFRG